LDSDIYYTPFSDSCWYAAFGTTRLYDYQSLGDLRSEAGGLPGGFFVDSGQGRLYLRLPDRSDPAGYEIHAAVLPGGFLVDTIHDVVIDGFEIRYYGDGEYSGFGVDIRGSDRVVVRECHIHNLNTGVRIRRLGAENLIENNRIEDTSVFGWPWGSVKAHTPEASGVGVGGGRGNVVRFNRISGPFNGIYTGEFTDTPDDEVAAETDVYQNTMRFIGDDGLEPEGACINVRFFDNKIIEVKNAVSLSPIQVGPTWCLYNLIAHYHDHVLKLNNGSTGPILMYHTTGHPADSEDSTQALSPSLPFGPFTGRNNIWSAHRYVIEFIPTSTEGVIDMDYDDLYTDYDGPIVKWFNVRYDTLQDFIDATGMESHGFNLEPAFEDVSGEDFQLAEGHQLLDQGEIIPGINDDPLRVPDGLPDIGAVERGGATIPDGGPPDAGGGDDGGIPAGDDAGTGTDTSADTDTGADTDTNGGGPAGGCGCGGSPGFGLVLLPGFILILRRKWNR
jgi:hypothetical protein